MLATIDKDCLQSDSSSDPDISALLLSQVKAQFSTEQDCTRWIRNGEIKELEKIGEGEFGVVMKGLWNKRPCAVKRLKIGSAADGVEVQRLMSELSILTGVGSHPNIVGFYGAWIDNESFPAIVEEYVDGVDLENFLCSLSENFRIKCFQIQSWSLDIVKALEYLHALDPIVVHRDIKPANILLDRRRRTLKLADFGLSKQFRFESPVCEPSDQPDDRRPRRLHTSCIGTPRYAAPEVFQVAHCQSVTGAAYTEKADIYSAALIIYYLLTGRKPHHDIRKTPFARPNAQPAVQRWPALADLLRRMWAHDPAARPAARECAEELLGMAPPGLSAAGCGCGAACPVQ